MQPAVHIGSFDRPNLTYRVLPRVQFRQQLQTILRRHEGEAGIIYCLSRREVDELAATLAADGIRAMPYHAGLDDATRHRNQDAFLSNATPERKRADPGVRPPPFLPDNVIGIATLGAGINKLAFLDRSYVSRRFWRSRADREKSAERRAL